MTSISSVGQNEFRAGKSLYSHWGMREQPSHFLFVFCRHITGGGRQRLSFAEALGHPPTGAGPFSWQSGVAVKGLSQSQLNPWTYMYWSISQCM